jgi:hypothetical protein
VTFAAERLARHEVHLLGVVSRTTNDPWWVTEVQNFLLVDAPKQVLSRTGHVLLVRDDDGVIIAVSAHRQHQRFRAQLVQAFLVLPEMRGLGLAEPALRCALDEIHRSIRAEFVMWLVHQDNAATLTVSNRVAGGPIGAADHKGFVAYVEP